MASNTKPSASRRIQVFSPSTSMPRFKSFKRIYVTEEIECACVELDLGKEKNVIVCCIYRAPGGSVDLFNKKI